jgi:hypothetical protein
MPIRFRCAYCNQLLSIATRKAGTVVKCPTCAGQVVVPSIESLAGVQSGDSFVMERGDLPQVVEPDSAERSDGGTPQSGMAVAPPGSWGTHAEPPYDLEKLRPSPVVIHPKPGGPHGGVVLTRRQLVVGAFVAFVLLILVFGAGLLLGHYSVGASGG